MVKRPADLYETIREEVNARMFAKAGARRSPEQVEADIVAWLKQFAEYSLTSIAA